MIEFLIQNWEIILKIVIVIIVCNIIGKGKRIMSKY